MKKLWYPLMALLFAGITSCCADKAPEKEVYLFSYFMGNGEGGLHLAASQDGKKWEALKDGQSILKPVIGKDKLMRDPSIVQDENGVFHKIGRAHV